MSDNPRFLIVGAGKMGEAILSGWLSSADGETAEDFVVVNPGQERRDYISQKYGVRCVSDVSEAPRADIVVLAVKPQVMMGVLEQIAAMGEFAVEERAGSEDGASGAGGQSRAPLFVSIAAGLTTDRIASAIPAGAPVVRVMPNMPLQIGAGASGVCGGADATEGQVQLVADLFAQLGSAVVVDEAQMDAVCALSGSGPAYVAAMIEALIEGAVQQGLPAELAEDLAVQTVLGTARLIAETSLSPEQARISVCSPGGTTLAALDAMEGAGFSPAIVKGVEAAVNRSKELAQCT